LLLNFRTNEEDTAVDVCRQDGRWILNVEGQEIPLVADSDSDGVNDRLDAFPINSAASLDIDGDGLPDAWNAGCDVTCQGASGLTLDTSVDCPDYICVPFTRGWRSVILRPSP
jgi:hypothetical protein